MKVITRDSMIKAEAAAVESGQSYLGLMENAGSAAAKYITETVSPVGKTAVILCGCGNNGGDGFVIARILAINGARVKVIITDEPKTDSAAEMFAKMPGQVAVFRGEEGLSEVGTADIIVDALFGTGLSRKISGVAEKLIQKANETKAVRFAVDIPSGAECDTGRVFEPCFKAEHTITFEALKPCHILPPANAFCGRVKAEPIGIGKEIIDTLPYVAETTEEISFEKRDKNSHKGTFGTALSVTGSYGMSGAAIMASMAALRSGVGIMKTAVIKENYEILAKTLPESVLIPCDSRDGRFAKESVHILKKQLKTASAFLIGCGLGVSNDTAYLVRETALSSKVPVIIDADGINAIAQDIEFIKQMKAPLILTPHPGEFSRLTGLSVKDIESDRIGAARDFAESRGVYLVLKGANTLIATPEGKIFVNMSGNPGLATGGSGDILSGMLLALLAREKSVEKAVCAAVKLHGDAADIAAAEIGETSLLPRDILFTLPHLFK